MLAPNDSSAQVVGFQAASSEPIGWKGLELQKIFQIFYRFLTACPAKKFDHLSMKPLQ